MESLPFIRWRLPKKSIESDSESNRNSLEKNRKKDIHTLPDTVMCEFQEFDKSGQSEYVNLPLNVYRTSEELNCMDSEFNEKHKLFNNNTIEECQGGHMSNNLANICKPHRGDATDKKNVKKFIESDNSCGSLFNTFLGNNLTNTGGDQFKMEALSPADTERVQTRQMKKTLNEQNSKQSQLLASEGGNTSMDPTETNQPRGKSKEFKNSDRNSFGSLFNTSCVNNLTNSGGDQLKMEALLPADTKRVQTRQMKKTLNEQNNKQSQLLASEGGNTFIDPTKTNQTRGKAKEFKNSDRNSFGSLFNTSCGNNLTNTGGDQLKMEALLPADTKRVQTRQMKKTLYEQNSKQSQLLASEGGNTSMDPTKTNQRRGKAKEFKNSDRDSFGSLFNTSCGNNLTNTGGDQLKMEALLPADTEKVQTRQMKKTLYEQNSKQSQLLASEEGNTSMDPTKTNQTKGKAKESKNSYRNPFGSLFITSCGNNLTNSGADQLKMEALLPADMEASSNGSSRTCQIPIIKKNLKKLSSEKKSNVNSKKKILSSHQTQESELSKDRNGIDYQSKEYQPNRLIHKQNINLEDKNYYTDDQDKQKSVCEPNYNMFNAGDIKESEKQRKKNYSKGENVKQTGYAIDIKSAENNKIGIEAPTKDENANGKQSDTNCCSYSIDMFSEEMNKNSQKFINKNEKNLKPILNESRDNAKKVNSNKLHFSHFSTTINTVDLEFFDKIDSPVQLFGENNSNLSNNPKKKLKLTNENSKEIFSENESDSLSDSEIDISDESLNDEVLKIISKCEKLFSKDIKEKLITDAKSEKNIQKPKSEKMKTEDIMPVEQSEPTDLSKIERELPHNQVQQQTIPKTNNEAVLEAINNIKTLVTPSWYTIDSDEGFKFNFKDLIW